jgi:hypothetical protein
MISAITYPVSPYPGWERRTCRLSRPITPDDIRALLGNEELYIRETAAGPVNIIHKYGLLEIHARIGDSSLEVWFNPDKGAYPSEYLDALLMTRFY